MQGASCVDEEVGIYHSDQHPQSRCLVAASTTRSWKGNVPLFVVALLMLPFYSSSYILASQCTIYVRFGCYKHSKEGQI